jgi:hypothetical protein
MCLIGKGRGCWIGQYIIYINSVSLCFCDGGFGGGRKGEAGEAAGKKSSPTPHVEPDRSKFGSAEPGQVKIRECRAGSVYNRPLPPPPPCRARSTWTSSPVTDKQDALCIRFTLVMDKKNVLFQPTSHKRQSWIRDHATHATCKCTNESLEEALDVMKKKGNFNKEDPTIMKYIFLSSSISNHINDKTKF